MKNILKLEEATMLGACIYALSLLHAEWWAYFLLLIGPDISMLGYLGGNKIGSVCYNLFHHKGIATAIFISGIILKNESLQIVGIILFGHSSIDRMFGYGLKLSEGFKYTHLGIIGKNK